MLLPDVVMLARTVTPDALSTAVVLPAMFLAGAKKDYWAVLLLLISLGIRTDNLFFLAGVLMVAIYRGTNEMVRGWRNWDRWRCVGPGHRALRTRIRLDRSDACERNERRRRGAS